MQVFPWLVFDDRFEHFMFVLMPAICAVRDSYFGFVERKSKQVAEKTDDHVGGRSMIVFDAQSEVSITVFANAFPISTANLDRSNSF